MGHIYQTSNMPTLRPFIRSFVYQNYAKWVLINSFVRLFMYRTHIKRQTAHTTQTRTFCKIVIVFQINNEHQMRERKYLNYWHKIA